MKNLNNCLARRVLTLITLSGASLSWWPSIMANPSQHPDTIGKTLKEISVEGSKRNKDIKSTSAQHSIKNTDLNLRAISDVGDAIRRLPGIMLRDYGGTGSLKTVSVRGLGSQHTGIAYDGAPLSDVQSGQIDLSRYSLDYMNSMSLTVGDNEDIFVPARMAASSSSLILSTFGNKLDIIRGYKLTARMKAGSFGFVNPSAHMMYGNGKNLAMAFTGDFVHALNNYPFTIQNGSEKFHGKRENSDINSGHAEYNIHWKPGIGQSLRGKVYYFGSYRHLPGPAILYNDESHEALRETNIFAQLNYTSRLSRLFSFSGLAKFNWVDTHYTDLNGKYPGGKLSNRYLQRETYASGSLLFTPGHGVSLAYSIDWFYNDLRSNSIKVENPHRNSLLQSLAATYKVWRLTLTARALYSLYKDKTASSDGTVTNSRFSPSVGISLRPISEAGLFIRMNYKNIFRMPTFNELYFDHYGTVNLKPELTEQFNAGVSYELTSGSKADWLSSLVVSADGYFNIVKNKIVAIPYNMFVWTMTNMGRVHAYGIDAALSAEFIPWQNQKIIVAGNYSWQKALGHTSPEYLDWNKQVPYIPVHSGAFSIVWENPWVSIGSKAFGSGKRFTTTANLPSSCIGGYMDFGFMAYHTFKIRGHELELRADLLNAFNRQYAVIARYPMPGRSWLASLKFTL